MIDKISVVILLFVMFGIMASLGYEGENDE